MVEPRPRCLKTRRLKTRRAQRPSAECLQRTGSFKFRGAYNALAQLDDLALSDEVRSLLLEENARSIFTRLP